MLKVLISDSLSEDGIKVLKKEKKIKVDIKTNLTPKELKKTIKDYDALIIRSATKVTKEVIFSARRLKVIGRAGVGIDNVDVASATRRGIIVMNAPAGNTISTAEHTMSMLLALSRNIPQAAASLKEGRWDRKKFMGVELYNKTLGIVGLGRIGAELAKRARSFGMRILTSDPFLSPERAQELKVELVELKELLTRSDHISVHVPLTDDTYHLIGKKEFALMKDGVRILNCARGGILDEKALHKAIKAGKVAGAALDVFEKEPPADSSLVKLDKVVATPHLGASTKEAQVNVAVDICRQVTDVLLGRGIRGALNLPAVEPEALEIVEPYIRLAEKLGVLQAQLIKGHIRRVKIEYSGEVLEYKTSPITLALVKGLLTPVLGNEVNYVNAFAIAKERKIEITGSKSSRVSDFTNLISVEVETDKIKSVVAGTLFAKNNPRIVKIDEFYVDLVPEGFLIITRNSDVPGIVGHIGTILGKKRINIAGMTFGRKKKGGEAITVLNVDSPISKELVSRLKRLKHIFEVKAIRL